METPTMMEERLRVTPLVRQLHDLVHDGEVSSDRCALCIADELEDGAEAALERITQVDPFAQADGGRLLGALARANLSRLDIADAIRNGLVEVVSVERSALVPLAIRFEEVEVR